jgi:hypothetical protein
VSSGSSKLFVAKSDRQFSGFALVHDLVVMPYVLLDYLAVNGAARKIGIGSSILNFIAEYFKREGKCLVIESENPDFGDNKEERAKRIDFYLKNGGEIIQNVQYLLPPLDGTVHTEMKLILFNPKVDGINQSELKGLITNIYLQIYKRGLEDKYLLSILESIK